MQTAPGTLRALPAVVLTVILGAASAASAADESPSALALRLIQELDRRQQNSGDYQARFYMESKEQGKNDVAYEVVIYRRDDDDKLLILFEKPKAEAGKGYLRLDKNMFLYDPTTGKWERRTERERIGGTNSNRRDFDEPRLAEEYQASYVAAEKLGAFNVHHLELKALPGKDVAYPTMHLWVDAGSGNLLKEQDHALSGKLLRTTYYPKWEKMFSKDKGADIFFPREIRIYDEVEKGTQAVIVMREVTLDPLPANIFTKAWLEMRSR